MTDDADHGGLVAAIDQLSAAASGMAAMYGAYYRALRQHGIPKRLAGRMVRDHHYEHFVKIGPENDSDE
jgi:hypothetical protein